MDVRAISSVEELSQGRIGSGQAHCVASLVTIASCTGNQSLVVPTNRQVYSILCTIAFYANPQHKIET